VGWLQHCLAGHSALGAVSCHGIFCSSCRNFGLNVASGSGLASAQAQGGWSWCHSQSLGSHESTSMAAGCRCCDCWSRVLGSHGTALAMPGWAFCSQHLVLASCHGIFWAGCKDVGPNVASRSSLRSAWAHGGWIPCHSPALRSPGKTLMAAGWWCWGCWSEVLGSCGTAPAAPG